MAKHKLTNPTSQTLATSIDLFWKIARARLSEIVDISTLPLEPGSLTLDRVQRKIKPKQQVFVKNKEVGLEKVEKKHKAHVKEVLQLFDASNNGYRSLTNILLNFKKTEFEINSGEYDLVVSDYAVLNGSPLKLPPPIPNKSVCPICRRFEQSRVGLALITGNPQTDSIFQLYRSGNERQSMEVCAYCYLAGYVDLPTALIEKQGQSLSKNREYLFITTPLSLNALKQLLDRLTGRAENENISDKTEDDQNIDDDDVNVHLDDAIPDITPESEDENDTLSLAKWLSAELGVEGFDKFSILGLSRKRLRELRGFVLPSAGGLNRIVVLRIPVEKLVSEEKISGAVRRELIKATMFDFWRITGGSLHYNQINDSQFSVDGEMLTLTDLERASIAYDLANRSYARKPGKYGRWVLDSALFMLLLSQSRIATNHILHRAGRRDFPPGVEKIQEIIEMAEKLANDDWKFLLGKEIVGLLVNLDLAPGARGFKYLNQTSGKFESYSGYELTKWIRKIKMVRDPVTARAWGNTLINAYKREHEDEGPRIEFTEKIINLVEDMIKRCADNQTGLNEFSREIANMDYYLLFYYNQEQFKINNKGEQK